jgi:hypothetical protein
VSYYYTHIRMVKIQNTDSIKCSWGYGPMETLIHYWWECKMMHLL